MAEVHVRIDTGRKFWLDERIQQAFPDDYVLIEDEKPKKSATAAKTTGGDKGDQA